jgi:hypothetical protein
MPEHKPEAATKAPAKKAAKKAATKAPVHELALGMGCSIVPRGDGVIVQLIGGQATGIACKLPVKVVIVEA